MQNTDGFAFSTNQDKSVPQEGINLNTTNFSSLPDPVLADRAKRADFALGADSPGPQVLKEEFRQGNEQGVREQAAAKANTDFQGQKLAAIDAAVKQGAPVTDTDVNTIMAVGTTPEANPASVFEDKYGKNVITSGIVGEPGKNLVFQSAIDKIPEEVNRSARVGMAVVSRKQQVKGVLEEAQTAHDNLPWISTNDPEQQDKLGNLAKNVLTGGIAQYVNQRNLLNSDPENSSYLPGSNKLEQIQWLYLQPNPAKILRENVGPGSKYWKTNPSDALDFIKSAYQFSTSDALVNNIYGVASAASVLPIGMGLKVIGRLRKGVEEAPIAARTVSEITAEANATSVLKSSSKPPVTPGDRAAGVMDDVLSSSSKPTTPGYYMPEAAVQRPFESKSRLGEVRVENGKPRIFTDDGAEVALSRTPQEGHIGVSVEPGNEQTTFRTSRGSTYTVKEDGTTVRDRAEGKGNPNSTTQADTGNGGTQPASEKTIYVSPKDLNNFAEFQRKDAGRRSLVQDDNGKWGILQVDGPKAGKFVGNKVTASEEPAKGLHPVEIWDQGDKVHFGNKITSVEKNTAPTVKFGPKIVSPEEKDMRTAMADIVKAQGNELPTDVLSKMGQQKTASEIGASIQIGEKASETYPLGNANEIRSRVPTNAQPVPYYNDASSLSWRRANDIVNEFDAGLSAVRVERLTPQANQQMIDVAKTQVSKYNRVSSDAIRDQVTHWDHLTNTYAVETKIGKPNGDLFDTRANAEFHRTLQYRMGSAATVEQEGTKFYLSMIHHGDETQSIVRQSLAVGNETPRSWFNSLFSMATGKVGPSVRSAAYTQTAFQSNQRNTATHAAAVIRDLINDKAEALQAMSMPERNELRDILVHNRDYIPPGKSGDDRGFFYNSEHDFRQGFYDRFNKQPSDTQWKAYERYTQFSDLDWVLRESENMRDVVRQGVRNYSFKFTNREGNKVETGMIKGKEVPDFQPLITPDANVYDFKTNTFTTKYELKDGSAQSKEIMDRIKSGDTKIIQTYNPREKPYSEATGIKDDIHFVLADKFDNAAVRWGENVQYRPGGHVIYVPQNYVKQPQIGIGTKGRPSYFGDVALKAFDTQKEAELWAGKYTEAQGFIKAGDTAGFDNFVTKNLPETPDELRQMFNSGAFNLEHPFMHAVAGRSTLETNEAFVASNPSYQGLKDTFTAYNLSQNEERAFLAERGVQLNTVANKGTEANPVWSNVPAEALDPYSALGKGLSQVVRSRWMADYKMSAAEQWVQEFGHMFDQAKLPIEKLRLNPLYYLYNTDGVNSAVIKANPAAYAAMMTSRDNILRFIGAKDEVGSMVDGLNLSLINSIDKKFGNKWAGKAEYYLPGIKNIPQYMRTATFDMVDGMFNIVQFPQQALGFTNAIAIAPEHAARSMSAWYIANRMKHTEDAAILSSWGDAAVKMGWKKDQFMETYQAWKDSGVHTIAGEVSARSTFDDVKLFRGLWGAFVDKGRYFFKKGEEINRDVSYFTAAAEWRALNPDRLLDNRAQNEIMGRFSTLNMNMTRASNAAYNEGVLSIPTQFWTWNARHFEQMSSFGANRQLTVGEKARVFTMNSALYGIPSAFGGATFGLIPMANFDDIRQFAIKQGINLHDNFVSAMTKGLPEMMINALIGRVTGKQGDVDLHRFSPNADQTRIFTDIQTGKKEWPELVFGASGSMAYKVVASTMPAWAYLSSAFSKNGGFPLRMNDLVNAAEAISSFTNAEKLYVGLTTGTYVSKTDQKQTEVDKFESVLLGLGLGLNRVSDAWQIKNILEAKKSAQAKFEKRIMEDTSIAFAAGQRGDNATFDASMKRIAAWSAMAGFTHKEEKEIWKKVSQRQGDSFVDQMNKKWLEKGPGMTDIPTVNKFFENLNR